MKRRGSGTLGAADAGQRVLLQAWVHRRRDLGGLIFLNLRDRSGNVQVVVRPDEAPAAAAVLAEVRQEWVVEVEGEVAQRSPDAVNPEMATGEIEVVADAARVLSRAEVPPFTPDAKVEVSEESRLRYRYLDLRSGDLQGNLMLRHKATLAILEYFDEQGFVNVETPILTRSTPEGARDYLVPSRVHRGEFYAMPQSPQLFKQILMVAGLERYVQIARCFRDEDLRADRQPEFTQVDVEMSFADEEDVIAVIEGMFARLFPLVDVEPAPPFRRLTWAEAMARYGTDRPDLRCPLEIVDLGDLLGGSGFRGFRQAVEEGGVVRGLAVPGAASASRRVRDGWADLARSQGAAGVLTLTRKDGELAFQVKNVLSPDELAAVAERTGLEDDGAVLLAAGPEATTAAALGALRLAVAREYGLIDEDRYEFTWVTEFPLLEWDEDRRRWDSTHHPFTAPDPRDLDRLESDPGSVRSRAYDLVLNGIELGGGSIRIHRPELQERVFGLLGIGAEEARQRFGFLLEALSYGAPPHGGVAFGLDRIVMLMAGAGSLRDVIAFPKTTSATCLMTSAPAPVDADQLGDLGLTLKVRGEDPELSLRRIKLPHPGGTTSILVGAGALTEAAGRLGRWLDGRAVFALSDRRVRRLHGALLDDLAGRAGRWRWLTVASGEAAKELATAENLWQRLLAAGGKRDSRVLALGGGSVGDLAGFVAGCFLRGVEYVQLPTTLLAQVDAAVGGKTAVNLPGAKNSVGLFHHPSLVVADTACLGTLPSRELRSGLAEVIKMAALLDTRLLGLVEREWERLVAADPEALAPVVAAAVRAKATVVIADPKEGGARRLLNFGHTLGHALETALGYRGLRHGEAVAYGMLFALRLAGRRGLQAKHADRLRSLIRRLDPPSLPAVEVGDLLAAMARDKKARESGLVWVLPAALGRGEIVDDVTVAELRGELPAFLADPWA